jgi:signal transduction histidine kinase
MEISNTDRPMAAVGLGDQPLFAGGSMAALVFLVCVALTGAVAFVDWRVGWEISLFIFYAVPIALASWSLGSTFGMGMALLCSGAWLIAQIGANPFATTLGLMLALANRMFYFCVTSLATVAVRKRRMADQARILALEELRQVERDLVKVSEHEHQRIGQDLHDGLCQQLASISCAAGALAQELKQREDGAASDAELIERALQRAVREARDLAHGILPVHVDRQGLAVALSKLASNTTTLTGTPITLHETDFQFDDPSRSMHLYRIAQEAVANAVRHGQASRVEIFLTAGREEVELRIEDDGIGLALGSEAHMESRSGGMGLRTMRYRAQSMGNAEFSMQRRDGGGTVVRCRVRKPVAAGIES